MSDKMRELMDEIMAENARRLQYSILKGESTVLLLHPGKPFFIAQPLMTEQVMRIESIEKQYLIEIKLTEQPPNE
jgi:predicted NUDIX family NTP pyrophosphohydrolase